jgi:hypothetical protein
MKEKRSKTEERKNKKQKKEKGIVATPLVLQSFVCVCVCVESSS